MLDLAFRPDRRPGEPVHRQLERHLAELIRSGRLGAGERLPPARELAVALGLSRNTVTHSYRSLVDEGLLSAHVGRGTFVTAWGAAGAGANGALSAAARGFAWEGLVSRRIAALRAPAAWRAPAGSEPLRFDFQPGQVDSETLPLAALRRAFAEALGEHAAELARPPDPAGWAPLRQEIATALLARGIGCAPEEIVVVAGAQQALDLAARVLVDPGDVVVMEQPGYFGAALAFAAAEAQLVGVGVDAQGLRTDELARVLRARRVKLVLATPAVQCPTGVALGAARRRELLALADAHQTPILEDDYDAELRHEKPAVPALKAEDRAGQVLYVGTFSKALFPSLRVGYLLAPRPLLRRLLLARAAADFGGDALAQATLARLLASGALERHVRRVRRIYTERRQAMLDALAACMPQGVEWSPPAGGSAVWVALPAHVDAERLRGVAVEVGLRWGPGSAFFLDGRGQDCLHLSFAALPPPRIRAGIEALAEILRRLLARPPEKGSRR